jgi:hypothetical protein
MNGMFGCTSYRPQYGVSWEWDTYMSKCAGSGSTSFKPSDGQCCGVGNCGQHHNRVNAHYDTSGLHTAYAFGNSGFACMCAGMHGMCLSGNESPWSDGEGMMSWWGINASHYDSQYGQ